MHVCTSMYFQCTLYISRNRCNHDNAELSQPSRRAAGLSKGKILKYLELVYFSPLSIALKFAQIAVCGLFLHTLFIIKNLIKLYIHYTYIINYAVPFRNMYAATKNTKKKKIINYCKELKVIELKILLQSNLKWQSLHIHSSYHTRIS